MIDWQNFTPYSAVAGGIIIGLSAGLFVLFNGRIAGISGILGGIFNNIINRSTKHFAWRAAFIGGLLLPAVLLALIGKLPNIHVEANTTTLIIAGLLVGIGTRYSSGCTSGHGVCGLSRLSLRSLVATLTFMLAGFLMVFIFRHLLAG